MANGLVSTSTNPVGPWTFMESANPSPTAVASYVNLPSYGPGMSCWGGLLNSAALNCWSDTGYSGGYIGVTTSAVGNLSKGITVLQPGNSTHVAVRWKNPTGMGLTLKILARISDAELGSPTFDDGVDYWVIRKYNNGVLASGTVVSTTVNPLEGDTFSVSTPVGANEEIFFIVSRKAQLWYDTTDLDLLITAEFNCNPYNANPSPC